LSAAARVKGENIHINNNRKPAVKHPELFPEEDLPGKEYFISIRICECCFDVQI
jgi:hypothetical protein